MPASRPNATPVADPMATLELLLLQVPPAGVEFKVVVNPKHIPVVPVIAVGLALTVTVAETRQPVPRV